MPLLNRRTVLTLMGGTVLAAPFVKRARAEGTLAVYNWADYIGETTVEDFQSATGIPVTYDLYASAEEMQAKMLAGATGYDVVVQSGLGMPNLLKANIYEKLDRSKLPNWKNLDPAILKILESWDPGNLYGVPYMWGSVGMSYNVDMVKERLPNADLESLDVILKPENAEKLADCGISILDSPTDFLFMVLKYIGKNPDTATEADFRAAAEVLKPVRKYIKTFDNANYLNAIPNKELCAINNWSGDYATAQTRAKEAGVEINLAYYVPKTGAPAWVDNVCIPSDSANKDNAHAFINYLMDPEVIAKCSNFTNYANGNLASKPFLDKAIIDNPAVYPDAETMSRLYAPKAPTEEQERIFTRVWTDIKSG
ncbi:polyamine ABC transporter substrate-binding protein [Rhizobium sp. KVB221]|uniref:Putrescine-binding periplasmic protein n=1 Tax=Rhizobium setariae TaxID=2801340 RepID=A0A936YKV1_9HYPH|nr:polyamine ABC transporter substrate-binding protein [Rhizobium setariae]MBL0372205.1 polyamine ABC transporter substrate-binding protein [Rhizobium setariae]